MCAQIVYSVVVQIDLLDISFRTATTTSTKSKTTDHIALQADTHTPRIGNVCTHTGNFIRTLASDTAPVMKIVECVDNNAHKHKCERVESGDDVGSHYLTQRVCVVCVCVLLCRRAHPKCALDYRKYVRKHLTQKSACN